MDISLNPVTRCTPRRNTSSIKLCTKSKRALNHIKWIKQLKTRWTTNLLNIECSINDDNVNINQQWCFIFNFSWSFSLSWNKRHENIHWNHKKTQTYNKIGVQRSKNEEKHENDQERRPRCVFLPFTIEMGDIYKLILGFYRCQVTRVRSIAF